jgi:hypothetical protein
MTPHRRARRAILENLGALCVLGGEFWQENHPYPHCTYLNGTRGKSGTEEGGLTVSLYRL